ncbi:MULTISPECIES: zinc dependent phospholipase C family protein [unclassified Caballeronia]|uniref:zinc dependent phospholipase C family protein n=1 Tax=unclassified Caballeronia TaxID=2646786 RepID=UPI0020287B66|nr:MULTISPECIES: zinc dependent phospholipase C family protein [unclassified Caballeronia]
MPKFGAHIIIADVAKDRAPGMFKDTLDNAYRLGAVGPDLTLFLFDPFASRYSDAYTLFVKVMEIVSKIKDKLAELEELLQPGKDLANWVSGGLSSDVSDIIDYALDATLLGAKLGLANGISSFNIQNPLFKYLGDPNVERLIKNPEFKKQNLIVESLDNYGFPLRMFGHPLTNDPPWKRPEATGVYDKWWWMDMLHYRNTGEFARTLLEQANDQVTSSYAKGYLSHVAGDICGHPFINGLVGGPFRNHAYRHMVLEALADTWLWDQQGRGDIAASRMDRLIEMSDADFRKISTLVILSMKKVYVTPMVPNQLSGSHPSSSELLTAYRAMQLYIRHSTAGKIDRPKPPPENPGEIFKEIQDILARNNPGAPPKWNPNSPLDYLAALFGWFFKGIVFIAMIATLPEAVIARFIATATGVRWLLYMVKLAIFMIVSGIRTILALMGWGYAGKDDFKTFGFLSDLITFQGDRDIGYRRSSQYLVPAPKPPYYWMEPPRLRFSSERQPTRVGPMPFGVRMDWLLDPNNAYDPVAADAILKARTPGATVQAETQDDLRGFGNAPDFFNMMLRKEIEIPDLDLDGDRGWGYKPWEVLPPNERYLRGP